MPNNSGITRVVINTRERAVSTDINRLQSEQAKSRANMAKRIYNDEYAYETASGFGYRGHEFEPPKTRVPMSADIFGGLRVRIQADFLLVTPGSVGIKACPGSFDPEKDSDYLLVDDPGVVSTEALIFNANIAVARRCDIVEFSVGDVVLKSESRDIYDPLTGLFTASLVTKIAAARLVFRIREGTVDNTFPGLVVDWCPIAVAVHEGTSLSFADVTFYDVRPLIIDRVTGSGGKQQWTQRFMQHRRQHVSMNFDNFIESYAVGGTIELITGNPGAKIGFFHNDGTYLARGVIGQTLPGKIDTGQHTQEINILDADYWAVGAPTPLADRWVYFLVAFPHNLPRWVKYTQTNNSETGEREPGLTTGLFFFTTSTQGGIDNGSVGAISLPTAYGMNGSTAAQIICPILQQDEVNFTPGEFLWNNYDWYRFKTGGIGSLDSNGTQVSPREIQYEIVLGNPGNPGDLLPTSMVHALQGDLTIQWSTTVLVVPGDNVTLEWYLFDSALGLQITQKRRVSMPPVVAINSAITTIVPIEFSMWDNKFYPNPFSAAGGGGTQNIQLIVNVALSVASANEIGLGTDGAVFSIRGMKLGF